ncbi:Uncharacterized protein FWK35_00007571 [Aphis craccivora]|uniref:Uncharacterized protein n=1 Tax=Aphis craccivora TaxID=307492 RepID=A0A6G0YTJ9_APHCR|nr:Uncharacterized protein FWK35_00007571 [Aphis craccivora]
MTISMMNLAYNSYEDKKVMLDDKIFILAHEHYIVQSMFLVKYFKIILLFYF